MAELLWGMRHAFKANTWNHAVNLSIFEFSVALELTGHLPPNLVEGY